MAQLLDVFGFVSVIFRGVTLALQTLIVGGLIFRFAVLRENHPGITRGIRWSARALVLCQILSLVLTSIVLAGTTGLSVAELLGANYFLAGCATLAGSLVLSTVSIGPGTLIPASAILLGTLATSHAAARLDHRAILAAFTLLHQLATAAWVGGLPYLVAVRRPASDSVWKRFSLLSLASVAVLTGAGVALSYFYVGSVAALYGSAYGVMVGAKVVLFAMLLVLGGVNYFGVRQGGLLSRLRGIGEVEIGLGFCVIFAAASLTSQPPAIDVTPTLVPAKVVVERITPRPPRLTTPPASSQALPGYERHQNDFAWSEYNHHWAGLVVLSMGLLAVAFRSGYAPWARSWPLLFVGLGFFLLLRADSESWPLGPYGFFESMRSAEVLQHRLAVLLIFAFAVFEWGVETGRLTAHGAALVFPVVCALGGGLLLTHSHSLTNVKEELLAELSHVPLALFGIAAGAARWLELRLPAADRKLPASLWPICFSFVGVVLLLYREM